MNELQDKINIVTGDIKEASGIFGGATFHVITTNPPYMNENHGLKNLKCLRRLQDMKFCAIWKM